MGKTRILALGFEGAHEMTLALRELVEAEPTFGFEFTEELLGDCAACLADGRVASVITRMRPELLVVCLARPHPHHAKDLFVTARQSLGSAPMVAVTSAEGPAEWCELLALGLDDYLSPPLKPVDVLPRLWRLRASPSGSDPLVPQLKEKLGLKQLIGNSPALLNEVAKIPLIARCDATVLLRGETGTGKEMFARAIHFVSQRSARPRGAFGRCGPAILRSVG